MSTYQGDERRDQTERGKELRKIVGLAVDALVHYYGYHPGRKTVATLYAAASMAWKHGHTIGKDDGAKDVMDHVEGELGAMREGMR